MTLGPPARQRNHVLTPAQTQFHIGQMLADELSLGSSINLLDRAGMLADRMHPLLGVQQRDSIIDGVVADLTGLGPLQRFMDQPDTSEVMVTGPGRIWTESAGHMTLHHVPELTEPVIMRVVERIIAPLGLVLNRASPTVDARLPDGSRLNAIIAPLAIDGPVVTIRRFMPGRFLLTDFASNHVATEMATLVRSHTNIVVSGGTGSGKTSLLNTLSSHIDTDERVVTIEDAAELQLPGRHVVRLEARPGALDGTGRVTIRDLVRNALRMRPDRLVVGEVRGGEAFDMVQALNTGHAGSMTTVHANTAVDAIRRLEVMVLMAGFDIPLEAVRQQLRSAIGFVIHVNRCGGQRKVEQVVAVADLFDRQ